MQNLQQKWTATYERIAQQLVFAKCETDLYTSRLLVETEIESTILATITEDDYDIIDLNELVPNSEEEDLDSVIDLTHPSKRKATFESSPGTKKLRLLEQ